MRENFVYSATHAKEGVPTGNAMNKYLHKFGPGISCNRGVKVLGGKGHGLAVMASAGVPVPRGVVVTTAACLAFNKSVASADDVLDEIMLGLRGCPYLFESGTLLSVRSGAPVSMPGMMDTILNIGITTDTIPDVLERIGEWALTDCGRRLVHMFGGVVSDIPNELFEAILTTTREAYGVATDAEFSYDALVDVLDQNLKLYKEFVKESFPDHVSDQMRKAIAAVFRSWGNTRAVTYRDLHGISHKMGTAVVIQEMVFGNTGDNSGSGVLFTRCPRTGADEIVGEFLPNAQGEDVVNGTRTPLPLKDMVTCWPGVAKDLCNLAGGLEAYFGDVQDVEFTVQDGELFILQTRDAKRSAQAAFQIAVDMVDEGMITRKQALERLTGAQYKVLCRPRVDDTLVEEPDLTGLPACGGVVTGVVATTSAEAVKMAADGKDVILVREFTSPDDIEGMAAAVGILTATGGFTSHAAVVARSMNKTCVVGCPGLNFKTGVQMDDMQLVAQHGNAEISIDGDTGRVWIGKVPVTSGGDSDVVATVLSWCLEEEGGSLVGDDFDPRVPGVQYVDVARWANQSKIDIRVKLKKLLTMSEGDLSRLVLLINAPSNDDSANDTMLWDVAEVGRRQVEDGMFLVSVMTILENLAKEGAKVGLVTIGSKSAAISHAANALGAQTLERISTMTDLVNASGPCLIGGQFIDTVCAGNEDTVDAILAKFENVSIAEDGLARGAILFGLGKGC